MPKQILSYEFLLLNKDLEHRGTGSCQQGAWEVKSSPPPMDLLFVRWNCDASHIYERT